jgi:glycosyltransferase involved in cell wall biosynthesis
VERYAAEITRRLGSDIRIYQPNTGGRGVTGHAWEQILLPLKLDHQDILWSPANTGPLLVKRQVLTLHDIAWLEHPEWFRPSFSFAYHQLIPKLARQVTGIITDSNYSKIRILDRLQISEDRLFVVPCGVDHLHFHPVDDYRIEQVRSQYKLDAEYILYVGSLAPHKNILTLLNAWSQLQSQHPGLALVIIGASGGVFARHAQQDGSLTSSRKQRVVTLGYIPDAHLVALYSGALVYVHPSLSEGFGLTLLEAMACGAPVVSAHAGSLPETAGEAALYFDPDSSEELTSQLSRVISDAELRDRLRRAGFSRARKYSWDASASAVRDILLMV